MFAGKAAGLINTKTIACSLQGARNIAIVDLTDNLDSAFKTSTNEMIQKLELISESPNTKRAKDALFIKMLIKLALEEINLLKEMNQMVALLLELKKAVDNLHDLCNQCDN